MTQVIDFIAQQAAADQADGKLITDKLRKEVEHWVSGLEKLRGDNIYDVARLWYTQRVEHSEQKAFEVDIEDGKEASDTQDLVSDVIERKILNPQGLRMIRTVMGRLIVSNETIIGALVNPGSTAQKVTYDILGRPLFVEWFLEQVAEHLATEPTPFLTRWSLDSQGGLCNSRTAIPPVKPIKDIGAFYPYFDKTPAEEIEAFMASSSNVLLLIGPPGTGKSNWILQAIKHLGFNDNVNLADRDDVLTHRNFPDIVRDLKNGSLMITEDSDKMVMKRTEGNATMSALLNATAGIVQRKNKLIISTNLPTTKDVDEALTRPGRCYKILEFGNLSYEEANNARAAVGKEEAVFDKQHGITLAEALNAEEMTSVARRPSFGFASRG